jgi:hypothetical protein
MACCVRWYRHIAEQLYRESESSILPVEHATSTKSISLTAEKNPHQDCGLVAYWKGRLVWRPIPISEFFPCIEVSILMRNQSKRLSYSTKRVRIRVCPSFCSSQSCSRLHLFFFVIHAPALPPDEGEIDRDASVLKSNWKDDAVTRINMILDLSHILTVLRTTSDSVMCRALACVNQKSTSVPISQP